MRLLLIIMTVLFGLVAVSGADPNSDKVEFRYVRQISDDINQAFADGEKPRLHTIKKAENGCILDDSKKVKSLRRALTEVTDHLKPHKDEKIKLIIVAHGFNPEQGEEISNIIYEGYRGKVVVYITSVEPATADPK